VLSLSAKSATICVNLSLNSCSSLPVDFLKPEIVTVFLLLLIFSSSFATN